MVEYGSACPGYFRISEDRNQLGKPSGVWNRVIVNEGDNLTGCQPNSNITRARQIAHGTAPDLDAASKARNDVLSTISGRAVYNDDFNFVMVKCTHRRQSV